MDMAGHGLRARGPVSADARPFDAAAFADEISPLAGIDLDAAADLLVTQITALAAGEPVVVVAHSARRPGAVPCRAERPPSGSPRGVRLRLMPASDVPAVAYVSEPEQDGDRLIPLQLGDPTATGALRLDAGAHGRYRQALRDALYGDLAEADAEAAIALLTPDAPARVTVGSTTLTADGWGSVRRTYVHCSQDYVIPARAAAPVHAGSRYRIPRQPHGRGLPGILAFPLPVRAGPLADAIAAAR